MTELNTLIRKRGTIKFKLTNFSKYFEPLHVKFLAETQLDKKEIIELQIRVGKLELLYDEFEAIQQEIELVCSDEQLEGQYTERSSFTDSFSDILAKAKSILEKYDNDDSGSVHSGNSNNSRVSNNSVDFNPANINNFQIGNSLNNTIKLPPIKCPTFNCEFNTWLEFKDTFEALFHNNSTLSDIQKYHYLRSCLGTEALKIIQSLEFAAHNYNDAWELLCDRFDNKRLLVNNHLKSLFEIEIMSKESAVGLRSLIDSVNKHLRALNTLALPTDEWDAMIIYMISLKLDKNTNREWEKSRNEKTLPSLKSFFEFIKNRADFLETLEMNSSFSRDTRFIDKKSGFRGSSRRQSFLINGSDKEFENKCNFCKKKHLIYTCDAFLKLSVPERWDKVRQMRMCTNCLCFGHYNVQCKSKGCKFCSGKHSSLLHHNKPIRDTSERENDNHVSCQDQHKNDRESVENKQSNAFNGSSVVCVKSTSNENYVLLSTAIVNVQDKRGCFHKAQVILDSGSQCSFISEEFSKRLGLNLQKTNISVSGINDASSNLKLKCEVLIKSNISEFEARLNCLVVPKISDRLPSYDIDISDWIIPNDIKLANPEFYTSKSVDMLIGADLFWNILQEGKIILGKNKPMLINTVFGYVVSGSINLPIERQVKCNFVLNDDLQKFWSIEEIHPESPRLTKEEAICENYFNDTVSRDNSGKFVVRFPLKCSPSELGESKDLAIKRLLFQEKRLLKNNDLLKNKYLSFMNEYIELEHMRRLVNPESINLFRCFLPHFAVIREDSLTTDVRIVFDASVKTKSGKSLNDIQYPGPAIQNDIFQIIVRFRQHKFVVIADIAKMYRQILIHPDERYLQNIVWRDDPSKDICVYELQTVTYGTSSAPYLAIKCVKKLAFDNKNKYPIACEKIDKDMYVDDLITGFNDEDEGIEICNQIATIMKSACFSLRKWASNSEKILKGLNDTAEAFSILDLGENDRVKTLGIQWLSHSDMLSFKVLESSLKHPITKRNLLSNIARIYDPLGLGSPCIILIKILIQNLWSQKLEWDDEVPSELSKKWEFFQSRLVVLNDLKVPRFVMCNQPIDIEIHGFSDASLNAYSSVIYVRTIDCSGNIYVRLLCSKTKVAPVKVLTIPRLELCGALILARLMKQVCDSFTCSFKTYYWCDSQIVLSWLNTDSNKLQVFVSNRISEIQQLCDVAKWSYVNTKDNPADIACRGMYPDDLIKCDVWWNGPEFLYKEADWPRVFLPFQVSDIPEVRKACKVFATTVTPLMIFEKFSSLNKLKRVFAYCLRFIANLKDVKNKTIGPLTVLELDYSMQNLVKLAQRDSFSSEISSISKDKTLNSKHRLLSLNPFLDSNGLLRVGGRLKNSSLPFNQKHPLLLDGKHKITKLIFQSEHVGLKHAGPQLLLFSVRQNYWATSGMNVAKKVVRECIKCFRVKPKPTSSIMADLPKHRVEIARPFSITGLDYAGPVILRDRKGRPYKTYKAYICLFICFVTKCIHIELVTDMTCEAFIATFRRFTARRGTPTHLYSDNGSNFVAAQKELNKLYEFLEGSQDEFVTLCAQERIMWHFIPPNSPNFGGLWESNVKAIKYHLYRVIGNSVLTYEEYSTLLVQIESILNSRPLYPMSSDPNDLIPLTPSHLLIGQSTVMTPDPLFEEKVKINRLTRFQLLQQLNHSFWNGWSKFYLSELQKRHKWKVGGSNVRVGDLVVIKNDNVPPCKWVLGRITEVFPGDDGNVRVVSVRTSQGVYKRGISKICPLPLQDNDSSVF